MGQIGKWYPTTHSDGSPMSTGEQAALLPDVVFDSLPPSTNDSVEVPAIVELTPSDMHIYVDPVSDEETVVVRDVSAEGMTVMTELSSFFSLTGPEQPVSRRSQRRRIDVQDNGIGFFDEDENTVYPDAIEHVSVEPKEHDSVIVFPEAQDERKDISNPTVRSTGRQAGLLSRFGAFRRSFFESLESTDSQVACEDVELHDSGVIDPLLQQDRFLEPMTEILDTHSETSFLPSKGSVSGSVMPIFPSPEGRTYRLEDVRMVAAISSDGAFPAPKPRDRMFTRPQFLQADLVASLRRAAANANEQLAFEGYGPDESMISETSDRRRPILMAAAAATVAVASVGAGMVLFSHDEGDKVLPMQPMESLETPTTFASPDFSTVPQDTVVAITVVSPPAESVVTSLPETGTTIFTDEPVSSRVVPVSIFSEAPVYVPRASIPELTTTTTEPAPTTTEPKVFYDNVYNGQQSVEIEAKGFASHLLTQYNELCGTNMGIDRFLTLLNQYNNPAVVSGWVAGTTIKMPPADSWCQ